MNSPIPLDIRTLLHEMVVKDLLGPAGGLNENRDVGSLACLASLMLFI